MAHGAPDYFRVQSKVSNYRLDDLGELAVRLGSPVMFDRLGDVIWLDSFENGLVKVGSGSLGVGGSVVLDGTLAKTGGFSAKLTTGRTASLNAWITGFLAYPQANVMGIEFSFAIENDIQQIALYYNYYTGSALYSGGLRYHKPPGKIDYYDITDDWVEAGSVVILEEINQLFHTMKLVFDMTTHKYVRGLINNNIYDLSKYSPYAVASTYNPHLYFYIYAVAQGAENQVVWLDDVIVTQNEPL